MWSVSRGYRGRVRSGEPRWQDTGCSLIAEGPGRAKGLTWALVLAGPGWAVGSGTAASAARYRLRRQAGRRAGFCSRLAEHTPRHSGRGELL